MFNRLLVLLAVPFAAFALSASEFPNPTLDMSKAAVKGKETVVLAGGCFWGMEGVFESLKGVSSAVSGYAGGSRATAHYETVSTGSTGHAESVKITFDPSRISFGQILKVYFSVAHDTTELKPQGPDSGTQYRSTIFAENHGQKRIEED